MCPARPRRRSQRLCLVGLAAPSLSLAGHRLLRAALGILRSPPPGHALLRGRLRGQDDAAGGGADSGRAVSGAAGREWRGGRGARGRAMARSCGEGAFGGSPAAAAALWWAAAPLALAPARAASAAAAAAVTQRARRPASHPVAMRHCQGVSGREAHQDGAPQDPHRQPPGQGGVSGPLPLRAARTLSCAPSAHDLFPPTASHCRPLLPRHASGRRTWPRKSTRRRKCSSRAKSNKSGGVAPSFGGKRS